MLVIATIPFLVMVCGGLVYAFASNGKASELGRLAFFAGLVVLMYVLAGHTVRIG